VVPPWRTQASIGAVQQHRRAPPKAVAMKREDNIGYDRPCWQSIDTAHAPQHSLDHLRA
jgi:hypothetical protein